MNAISKGHLEGIPKFGTTDYFLWPKAKVVVTAPSSNPFELITKKWTVGIYSTQP